MTPDQKTPLAELEDAIFSTRHKGRIEYIRKTFLDYRATILKKPSPWYKRSVHSRTSNGRAVRGLNSSLDLTRESY